MTEDFWQKAAVSAPDPQGNLGHGQSGYLSRPSPELDPALFDGDVLRDEVRSDVIQAFTSWITRHFSVTDTWYHLWITGSSISYQWDADRGNGDLDVMVGVDPYGFMIDNQEYQGLTIVQQASQVNQLMHESLWPSTANTRLGGKTFEVTYYWNPGTTDDIRVINPYAAYDLITNRWVVRPPELPSNPGDLYPQEWFSGAQRDSDAATAIVGDYHRALKDMDASAPGTPGWHDAGSRLHVSLGKAVSLFHDIHTGRKAAFSEQGQGYKDWGNFRYQRSKKSGALDALSNLNQVSDTASQDEETALYGAPIIPATVALARALAAHRAVPK